MALSETGRGRTEGHPLRLAYLIFNERIFSGLLESQVVALLKAVRAQQAGMDITLVSFLPPWVILKHRGALRRIREELRAAGIRAEYYPLALPYRWFLLRKSSLHLVAPLMAMLAACVLRRRFDIVHCRSYFPTMLAVALQGRLGFRTIFDSRSLFVDECVAVGLLAPGGGAHARWRGLEAWMLHEAAVSVGVSKPMIRIMRERSAKARLELIPCCVDVDTFRWDPVVREQMRREEGWEQTTVVVFEGNIGRFSDLPTCIGYFKRIERHSGDAVFLVITPAAARQVREECRRGGLPDDRLRVVSVPHGEVWKWLSAADVGLHTLGRDVDKGTRLGIKFVEYLSCGLPVVCTPSVGGAAEVVREYGVGVVVELQDPACDDKLRELLQQRMSIRPRCRATAEKLFSVRACANAYLGIYRSLARPGTWGGGEVGA